MKPSRITSSSPLVIAAAFLALGVAWIFVTDMLASLWFSDPRVQTVKGIVFVVGTAALLWGLLRLDRDREERTRVRLRESEHRFRTLIENAGEIISILDADARPVFRSEGFTRILGYRPKEVGSSFELVHPEDLPTVRETFEWARQNAPQTTEPVEFRIRHRDGGWRLLEATAMDLSHIPAVGGVVVNARDITERRAAEISREAAESRFRQIVEHAHEGVWTIDAEGRTTYVNDRMAEMLGTGPEALIGRNAADVLPPERRDELSERLERRRRGESEMTETEFVRVDGERIRVQISAGPLFDEAGEFAGVIEMVADVSDRHALEERLREKRKMEAVGRLAGGIAHDFNNLLTAIRGYAEMLRGDFEEEDPRRESAGEIVRAANRAATLTDQLLAFGRQQMLAPRRLDLADVVRDAEPELRELLPEDVSLEVDVEKDLPAVRVDPGRTREILVNLVVNAREAMPDGGMVRIELDHVELTSGRKVGADFTVPPGEYVSLTVADTGTGMDPETRRRAFDPFFTTKQPSGRGAGLGLSAVYGVVKQSGGYVWPEKGAGEGTVMRILLPVDEEVPAGVDALPPPESSAIASGEPVVLLVEDEPSVRRLARTVLERAGYRIIEAEDGRDALESLRGRRRPVDLVVTDILMPSMGGEELVDRLRERWPDLKVLFMSGYTDARVEDGSGTRADGTVGSEFLAKPFTPAELIGKVRETMGHRAASAE